MGITNRIKAWRKSKEPFTQFGKRFQNRLPQENTAMRDILDKKSLQRTAEIFEARLESCKELSDDELIADAEREVYTAFDGRLDSEMRYASCANSKLRQARVGQGIKGSDEMRLSLGERALGDEHKRLEDLYERGLPQELPGGKTLTRGEMAKSLRHRRQIRDRVPQER